MQPDYNPDNKEEVKPSLEVNTQTTQPKEQTTKEDELGKTEVLDLGSLN